MADLPKIQISQSGATEAAAIRSFYSSVGYGGGVGSPDRVFVAREGRSILAAAKLSPEDGTVVLRGMYVSVLMRGRGIGSALLECISTEIGPSACWCIPYTHLVDFYSRIGFRIAESEGTPEFLLARQAHHVLAGHEVTIMRRPQNWGSDTV
jgi:GNAT superfamily N-acetyltransferase